MLPREAGLLFGSRTYLWLVPLARGHPGCLTHLCPPHSDLIPTTKLPLLSSPPTSTQTAPGGNKPVLFFFTVYKSLKLDMVLFFSSKSSWNVAVFTKKKKSKERDYNYGSGPRREASARDGGFPGSDIFCFSKEPGILAAAAENKNNLGVCLLFTLSILCPQGMRGS